MTANDRRWDARIRIESKAGNEHFSQTVQGAVYRKGKTWYLRYEERDDDGAPLRTVVKLADDEWVVTRRGAVSAELRFARGRTCRGYYRIGGMELALMTRLTHSRMEIGEGRGTVRMEYGLSIGGEPERSHSVTYRLEPVRHGPGRPDPALGP